MNKYVKHILHTSITFIISLIYLYLVVPKSCVKKWSFTHCSYAQFIFHVCFVHWKAKCHTVKEGTGSHEYTFVSPNTSLLQAFQLNSFILFPHFHIDPYFPFLDAVIQKQKDLCMTSPVLPALTANESQKRSPVCKIIKEQKSSERKTLTPGIQISWAWMTLRPTTHPEHQVQAHFRHQHSWWSSIILNQTICVIRW